MINMPSTLIRKVEVIKEKQKMCKTEVEILRKKHKEILQIKKNCNRIMGSFLDKRG